jgi:SAM-dependent methyltransferase
MTQDEKLLLANSEPAWMYEFDLGDGVKTRLLSDELRSIHQTREEMIMSLIDRLFPEGLRGNTCLDVACNEGYFSQLLYRRGGRVKGIDVREVNIQRACAVREIMGYDPARLVFQMEDFFNNQDPPGSYHITFFLGILYHLENPMGALRKLRSLTKTVSVIETQLTRQCEPIMSGWGQTSVTLELPASLALHQQTDVESNRLAAINVLSFVPNAAAVKQMLYSAGFSTVAQICARPWHNPQYVNVDRGVFLAFP